MSNLPSPDGREPVPAFLAGPPLATIGPLPPDLLAAFNGAVYLAGTANSIRRLLDTAPAGCLSQETVRAVIAMVDQLRAVRNACNAAIAAVTNDLNATRNRPAYFGEIVESNAHQVAIALARAVLRDVWNAADPIAYLQCFLDPSARMDSSLISERFEDICEHFRVSLLPDSKEIIAEIQLEAAKAAQARPLNDTDSEPPPSIDKDGVSKARDRTADGKKSPVAPSEAAMESKASVQSDMTWQEAAKRMKRLQAQGEGWTSQQKMAEKFGCSSGTINKAIKRTPELQNWAKRQSTTAPRAQSLNDVVTDRTAQSTERNPEDDAVIREFIERADPEAKAWFLALPLETQFDVANDPDKYERILGRKP
jgi:hypothetical protein